MPSLGQMSPRLAIGMLSTAAWIMPACWCVQLKDVRKLCQHGLHLCKVQVRDAASVATQAKGAPGRLSLPFSPGLPMSMP